MGTLVIIHLVTASPDPIILDHLKDKIFNKHHSSSASHGLLHGGGLFGREHRKVNKYVSASHQSNVRPFVMPPHPPLVPAYGGTHHQLYGQHEINRYQQHVPAYTDMHPYQHGQHFRSMPHNQHVPLLGGGGFANHHHNFGSL